MFVEQQRAVGVTSSGSPTSYQIEASLLAGAFVRNEQRDAALPTDNAEQRHRWMIVP